MEIVFVCRVRFVKYFEIYIGFVETMRRVNCGHAACYSDWYLYGPVKLGTSRSFAIIANDLKIPSLTRDN